MFPERLEQIQRQRVSIGRRNGLVPIGLHVARLLRRADCSRGIVVEVLRSAGLDDDATGAPLGGGQAADARQ